VAFARPTPDRIESGGLDVNEPRTGHRKLEVVEGFVDLRSDIAGRNFARVEPQKRDRSFGTKTRAFMRPGTMPCMMR